MADDPAMTPLLPSLRVLGVPALHGPDGEPITLRTRKHFALLIYLALEPQTHRREKLGALLWPGATTAEARHSLATGLSVLRARLGRERLETDRDTVRLAPGALEVDIDRLARGEVHATETTPALAVAPLLQEFVVADAGPWDQWRDALAAKWHPAIRDALLTRIDRSRRQGNTRAMEVLADALLQLDDLSEEGIRAKMESRAFAGDRLTALQLYEAWRVRLADELGAQPSDLVAGMALRLRRRGWERTSSEHIPAIRTDQWKDRHFVGRAKEYEVLYEGWEGCQRGALRHVLLTGESGVGKSTLVERLTTAAGLQGAVATRIQCHEVEKEIPYGAIGGLIALLLDRPGATAVAPEWLSELSRSVSAVRRRFPNVAPPPEATGEMVRIRLADAFHELVRAIAEEQPLILVMDDIHLGDDASVAVIHLLLRRLTDERILVVCTLRQGEGVLAPSARGMLERAEIAQMSVVPLPPLSEGESVELLAHLVPGEVEPPPSTVRRALLRAGGGLPMLLELLVRDWTAHGDRCVALAVDAMTEEPGAAGGAGETYRRLLERLTVGLDPSTRSVLNLAAVLGSQLNEFELYGLVDLTLAQAMAGLSQLAMMRILRDSGQGLEFVNEVMRGEVYLAVPSSVRKVLHSKVADRLIERAADGEETLGLAIAWHCMRSSRVQEAGEWLILGATLAVQFGLGQGAEAALTSALSGLSIEHRGRAQLLLAMVLSDSLRYTESLQALSDITEPDKEALGEALRREMAIATSGTPASASRDSIGHISHLQSLLIAERDDFTRLRLTRHSVSWANRSGDDGALVAFLEAFGHSSGPQLPPAAQALSELTKARLLANLRHSGQALTILRSLAASRTGIHSPSVLDAEVQLGLGSCLIGLGEYQSALPHLENALDYATRCDGTHVEANARANLALAHFRLGNYHQVILFAAPVLSAPTTHAGLSWTINSLAYSAFAAALLGHTEEALIYLTRGDQRLSGLADSPLHRGWALLAADACALLGRVEESHRRATEALRGPIPAVRFGGRRIRWAGRVFGVDDPRTIELIQQLFKSVEHLDLVDALELAETALQSKALPAETRAMALEIRQKAHEVLPTATLHVVGRLCVQRPSGELSSSR